MPLANSNGPRWIRAQHAADEKRREGLGPVRAVLAKLFGRRVRPPVVGRRATETEREDG